MPTPSASRRCFCELSSPNRREILRRLNRLKSPSSERDEIETLNPCAFAPRQFHATRTNSSHCFKLNLAPCFTMTDLTSHVHKGHAPSNFRPRHPAQVEHNCRTMLGIYSLVKTKPSTCFTPNEVPRGLTSHRSFRIIISSPNSHRKFMPRQSKDNLSRLYRTSRNRCSLFIEPC